MLRFSARTRFATLLLVSAVLSAPAVASNPEHVEQLRTTKSCAKCDLSDAVLTGEDLNGANLEAANLKGAKLGQATFYRSILRGADLTNADLAGADLSGAILEDAIGVNLAGATTDFRTVCPNGSQGPCQ